MKCAEFEFIRAIRKQFAWESDATKGIGDDCAVIPYSERESYLITTDALLEGVHFTLDSISFKALGWKAIAVNLSDIAAMGGGPAYIFLSLAIPNSVSDENMADFYSGVEQIARQYGVSLLGGDTTSSLSSLFLSVTAIGLADSQKILYRKGAQPGDNIYLTGWTGDSSAGLSLLEAKSPVEDSDSRILVERHLKPMPRVEEMAYLMSLYTIHSAIDTSDGLSGDLSHILTESGLGANIAWDNINISRELINIVGERDMERHVLHGGEDYEILFTSADEISVRDFQDRFKIPLARIGQVFTGGGILLSKGGKELALSPHSYDHFKREG